MKKSLTIGTRGSGLLLAAAAIATVAVPFTAYADTTGTTISSAIGSTIGVFSSSGTVNINATPTASGVQTTASDTVTVSTNNSAGYTLKLGETAASSSLVSGGNSIAATSGSQTTPIALTANTWGYRVDNIGGFGAGPTSGASNAAIGAVKYAAVPVTASPNTLKTTSAVANSDTTSVWYSVAVNNNTPSGTYTNGVTYTATTN